MDGALNHSGDPNIVHKNVIEMFPELDLTQIIAEFGHLTPEGLADVVIDRMALIPRKKHGMKRKTDEDDNDDVHSEYSSFNSETSGLDDLLVEKMLAELLRSCKTELRGNRTVVDNSAWTGVKTLMIENFPLIRADFVTRMIRFFNGAIVPTAIACFFVENNFGNKLHKIAPSLTQTFWCKMAVPLQSRGRRFKQAYVSDQLREHFKRYNELMEQYQKKYPELLSGLKLTKQARNIPWERSEHEQWVECLVCFERVTMRRMVCCTPPVDSPSANSFDASLVSTELCKEELPTELTAHNQQTDSVLVIEFSSELSSSRVSVLEKEEEGRESDSPAASHAFCRCCIRGQAQAATDEIPLAEGGVGLKCMVPGCLNPILYSDIRTLLKRDVRKKLDERIVEENIGMASLQNLERCKLCNFAMEMDVDKSVNKVFDCLNCCAKFCRFCERRWDEDHFGVSCEELDLKTKKDKKDRELEKKLNEAVIRKCPRCGLPFMKDEGCNKMTCRCGMKQCYLCRQSNIDYGHFCRHFRDPKVTNWKCNLCNKKCLLFQDANKLDSVMMDQIRKHEEEAERQLAGEGTSASAGKQPPQLDQQPTTSRGTAGGDATTHRKRMETLKERSRRSVWKQFPDNRQLNNDDPFVRFPLNAVGFQRPVPPPYQPNVPPPFIQTSPYPPPRDPRRFPFPPQDPRIFQQQGPMFFNQTAQMPPYPQDPRTPPFPPHDPRMFQQQQGPVFFNQAAQPPIAPWVRPSTPMPGSFVRNLPPAVQNNRDWPIQQPLYPSTPPHQPATVPQPTIAGAEMIMPPAGRIDFAFAGAEHAIQMFYNGGVPAVQQQEQQQHNQLQ